METLPPYKKKAYPKKRSPENNFAMKKMIDFE